MFQADETSKLDSKAIMPNANFPKKITSLQKDKSTTYKIPAELTCHCIKNPVMGTKKKCEYKKFEVNYLFKLAKS